MDVTPKLLEDVEFREKFRGHPLFRTFLSLTGLDFAGCTFSHFDSPVSKPL